jgi:hypothetical protein
VKIIVNGDKIIILLWTSINESYSENKKIKKIGSKTEPATSTF